MQGQGMHLPHQFAQAGIHLLVALHRIQADELWADNHRLVVGLQPAAVHVALVQHFEVQGLQGSKGRLELCEFRH
ncbi:hypothetical protein D9M68_936350 [compost metagenome]